jgi:hypothetical protein
VQDEDWPTSSRQPSDLAGAEHDAIVVVRPATPAGRHVRGSLWCSDLRAAAGGRSLSLSCWSAYPYQPSSRRRVGIPSVGLSSPKPTVTVARSDPWNVTFTTVAFAWGLKPCNAAFSGVGRPPGAIGGGGNRLIASSAAAWISSSLKRRSSTDKSVSPGRFSVNSLGHAYFRHMIPAVQFPTGAHGMSRRQDTPAGGI